MPNVQRLPGLWPEEQKAYEACLQYERNYNSTYHRSLNLKIRKRNAEKNRRVKEALEVLSACRALLEKHQWVRHDDEDSEYGEIWICPSCDEVKRDGHAPDCAWDAQLAGTRGGK